MMFQFYEWVLISAIVFSVLVSGYHEFDETKFHSNTTGVIMEASSANTAPDPLLVNLTLIPGAADTSAGTLSCSLYTYRLHSFRVQDLYCVFLFMGS